MLRPFASLTREQERDLFLKVPATVGIDSSIEERAAGLGATLYTPAIHGDLSGTIRGAVGRGVTSLVVCLEDAIPDDVVPAATKEVAAALCALASHPLGQIPQLYVRVRSAAHLLQLVDECPGELAALQGFVAPKFTVENAAEYLSAIEIVTTAQRRPIYLMPVLETPDIAHVETRVDTLLTLARMLRGHKDKVPAVRIGGTDLAGLFGMRRGPNLTCYDLAPVRDVMSDAINVFGRAEGAGFPITGCVWEYFAPSEKFTLSSPQLGSADLDGLVREVTLDIANGMCGKSVIHPSHVPVVHALLAVTHEEWHDAQTVVRGAGSHRSVYRNKMNEANPHAHWAGRVLVRGQAFGVLNENVGFGDLLAATS